MSDDDKIVEILKGSQTREEVLHAVRTFVEKMREGGESKEAILARMQELRRSVPDEQEDILLEVMDFLVGWCSPHAKVP